MSGPSRIKEVDRSIRQGKFGRGGKGIIRGLRKAIEPTEEFKSLQSQATMCFVKQRYDEAEHFILRAIHINPEIYEAHNLLSQIYAAKGDHDEAIRAAWHGAHTRDRDPGIWSRLAQEILDRKTNDRVSTVLAAIYCIDRIISLDRNNVEARYWRATLHHELSHSSKAATDYEEVLKQRRHDTTVLRHLAQMYVKLDKPERALEHYRFSLDFLRAAVPYNVVKFTWSDVNIVIELYEYQERYEEGLIQLKSLSRWLLGRSDDTLWETFNQDDREWDPEDQPRRNELPEFVPEKYDIKTYGYGMPLGLRVKLGIFRLKMKKQDLKEAMVSTLTWSP